MKRGLFLALIALAVVAQPVVAATTMTGPSAINGDAGAAHAPYVDGDMTKATHEMGWAAMEYENNNGEVVTHDAMLNETADNPYSFVFTDVEVGAYGEFPVNTKTEDVDSALNATGWTTDASGTAGSVSVADATTAPGVEAVQVSTSSQTSGDTAKATFDGFKITSDAQKRVIQVALDVNTLDAGADVFIRQKDTDGDYVELEIDPDDDANTGNNISNSTGDGFVAQKKVGDLAVQGTGDGTMDNINATTVVVKDGNADISIAALNVERTSPWTLGDRMADTDGDGDDETETLTEINESGSVSLTSLSSMGSAFDAATFHDVTVPITEYQTAASAGDGFERYNTTYEEASDYPSFGWLVDDYRRFHVETAYDLSYSNLELRDTVAVPDNRYRTVEYATAVGETNFSDISWTDATSSYSPKGEEVTLATGISAGDSLALHYDYLVTEEEYDALTATASGGAPMGDSGGGIGSIPIIGGVVVAFLSFLGLRGGDGGGA